MIRVRERPRKERAEETAARHLQEAGLDVYLPMMDEAPLFGGYLFAQLRDREIIERSRSMSLPEFNEVRDCVIRHLQAISWDAVKHEADPMRAGQTVRIKEGPFIWREAIVKAKQADRIIVLMQIMQTYHELPLRLDQVEAA